MVIRSAVTVATDPTHIEGLESGGLLGSEQGWVPAPFCNPAPQMETVGVTLVHVAVGDIQVFVTAPEQIGSMQAPAECPF